MPRSFDRRVVPDDVLEFVRVCQRVVPCPLGGGAALSGAYLGHRLSRDIDLVFHDVADLRVLGRALPDLAATWGGRFDTVRDAGSFVRGRLSGRGMILEVDLTFEGVRAVEPPAVSTDGVTIVSLADLRASKLTCILSRSEPRDLVDLLFLDREGYPPEKDLASALRIDAGMDPGVLGWLLRDFPLEPLPPMLVPLTVEELARFRGDLCERFRRMALPGGAP